MALSCAIPKARRRGNCREARRAGNCFFEIRKFLEARAGLEPANDDFADRSLNHLGTAPNETSSQELSIWAEFRRDNAV